MRRSFSNVHLGTYLINVARGKHLVEEDPYQALIKDSFPGAMLDVYRTEPLPNSSVSGLIQGITMTPHIGKRTTRKLLLPQLMGEYKTDKRKTESVNLVDRVKRLLSMKWKLHSTILCPTEFFKNVFAINAIEYAAKLGEKYQADLIFFNVLNPSGLP